MSIHIQAAIYSRVSSEHQPASRLAALRERLSKDGLPSHSELAFINSIKAIAAPFAGAMPSGF